MANRELMPSIRNGARLATEQCEYQFKYRRWNCSVPERDSKAPFRRITGKGKYLAIPLLLSHGFVDYLSCHNAGICYRSLRTSAFVITTLYVCFA